MQPALAPAPHPSMQTSAQVSSPVCNHLLFDLLVDFVLFILSATPGQRLARRAPSRGEPPPVESDSGVPRVVATAWRRFMFVARRAPISLLCRE